MAPPRRNRRGFAEVWPTIAVWAASCGMLAIWIAAVVTQ